MNADKFAEARRCVELLRANLCEPISASTPWKQLWKLLRVWEKIGSTQNRILAEAEAQLQSSDADAGLTETLCTILDQRAGERNRHLKLALCWRRHAIWRKLHRNPADIDGAVELWNAYFLSSSSPSSSENGTAHLKKLSAPEAILVGNTSTTCLKRIRVIKNWLQRHQDVWKALQDSKNSGKGKQRENTVEQERAIALQIRHIQQCIAEIEPPERLKMLKEATKDWLDVFDARLEAIQSSEKEDHGQKSAEKENGHVNGPDGLDLGSPAEEATQELNGHLLAEEQDVDMDNLGVQMEQNVQPVLEHSQNSNNPRKRRMTDRGTSPIAEDARTDAYYTASEQLHPSNTQITIPPARQGPRMVTVLTNDKGNPASHTVSQPTSTSFEWPPLPSSHTNSVPPTTDVIIQSSSESNGNVSVQVTVNGTQTPARPLQEPLVLAAPPQLRSLIALKAAEKEKERAQQRENDLALAYDHFGELLFYNNHQLEREVSVSVERINGYPSPLQSELSSEHIVVEKMQVDTFEVIAQEEDHEDPESEHEEREISDFLSAEEDEELF